jgi:hypothetical protein
MSKNLQVLQNVPFVSMLAIDIFLIRANSLSLIESGVISAQNRKATAEIITNVKNPAVVIYVSVKTGRHTLASEAKS